MPAETDVLDYARLPRLPRLPGLGDPRPRPPGGKKDEEADEALCPAFGFLRGAGRALTVEFRLGNGNTVTYPYSWLGPVRYDPSVGLLFRFAGDAITLVLIRGSNLAAPVGGGTANLTGRGFHRHRVLWVREMTASEARAAGAREPTVDRIEIAEFEFRADTQAWLAVAAPALAR